MARGVESWMEAGVCSGLPACSVAAMPVRPADSILTADELQAGMPDRDEPIGCFLYPLALRVKK